MRAEGVPFQTTLDAFHRGAFLLVQPAAIGHRAGTDAMILAAAVPGSFDGKAADLGAGAGAAGMAVAARCPLAHVTLVERSAEMLDCARSSLTLEENAALADRVALLDADVTLKGAAREAAGLARETFDFVVMNPPFNRARDRQSDDALKRLAHVMDETLFEDWLRTASAILKPRGSVAIVARPASLDAILQAMRGRFGTAELAAIHPRAEAKAIRIVLRARKGAAGALSIRPPLVLHGEGSAFTPQADAINNGRAALFDD